MSRCKEDVQEEQKEEEGEEKEPAGQKEERVKVFCRVMWRSLRGADLVFSGDD